MEAYLNVDSSDFAYTQSGIDLGVLGISEGDVIRIEQLGDFSLGASWPDDARTTGGVFSSSFTLLAPSESNPNRIPGAIDAGIDVVTSPTYWLGWETDIPEDFLIDDVTIQVPAGAKYLFVAALDVAYGDNTDPDHDYTYRLSKVPEPSALLLLGSGLAGIALLRGRLKAFKG
jgi:hypothetical protein